MNIPLYKQKRCQDIARAFCVVGGWTTPISDEKVDDINAALSRCSAFKEVSASDRNTILAEALAVVQSDEENSLNNVNETIGSEHGREMLEIMIALVLSWDPNADRKEQLMWHMNTDLGVSMDDYYKMWDRIASGSQVSNSRGISTLPTWDDGVDSEPQANLPNARSAPVSSSPSPPSLPNRPPTGRQQTEAKLLVQYSEEIEKLKQQLAELEPREAKNVQRQIEQKMQIFWKQITLVKSEFPGAVEGMLGEAAYYYFQAGILILSSGVLRRFSQGGAPIALRMASGLVAKVQESNDVAKAMELLEKSLRVFDTPQARYLKASILHDKGEKSQALAELNHIIAKFPDDDLYLQARQRKDEIENPPKKGCCFIATAAYGTPMATEVLLLSMFRDDVLLKSRPGRAFVACYYRLSPPIASFIGRFETLRAATRTFFLNPVLWVVRMICPQLAHANHHERQ